MSKESKEPTALTEAISKMQETADMIKMSIQAYVKNGDDTTAIKIELQTVEDLILQCKQLLPKEREQMESMSYEFASRQYCKKIFNEKYTQNQKEANNG